MRKRVEGDSKINVCEGEIELGSSEEQLNQILARCCEGLLRCELMLAAIVKLAETRRQVEMNARE